MNKMAKGRQNHVTQQVTATIREWQSAKAVLIHLMSTPFDIKDRARHSAQIDLSRRMLKTANSIQRVYEESGIEATRNKHLKENATQVGQGWQFNSAEAESACALAINDILDSQAVLQVPTFTAEDIDGSDETPGPLTLELSLGERAAIDFLITYPDPPLPAIRAYDTIDTFSATSGRGELD